MPCWPIYSPCCASHVSILWLEDFPQEFLQGGHMDRHTGHILAGRVKKQWFLCLWWEEQETVFSCFWRPRAIGPTGCLLSGLRKVCRASGPWNTTLSRVSLFREYSCGQAHSCSSHQAPSRAVWIVCRSWAPGGSPAVAPGFTPDRSWKEEENIPDSSPHAVAFPKASTGK